MIELNKNRPIANPIAVLREEFDEWGVLFNPDTADAVGINPVGIAIWKLMDGEHDLEQIQAEIQDQFAEVPEAAGEEISAFINDLDERGFIGYEVESMDQ